MDYLTEVQSQSVSSTVMGTEEQRCKPLWLLRALWQGKNVDVRVLSGNVLSNAGPPPSLRLALVQDRVY